MVSNRYSLRNLRGINLKSAAGPHAGRSGSIDEVDQTTWDELVPRDLPHMRHGFLKAVEVSGLVSRPCYLRAWLDGRLVGVAYTYGMNVDILTLISRKYTRWISAVRNRIAPKLLFLSGTVCGPIITNCNNNFCLASDLTLDQRQDVMDVLLREMESTPGGGLCAIFEFPTESAALYDPPMKQHGFIKAPSLPGTRLDIRWNTFDDYVASMRKTFRRTVVKDLQAAAGIDFEVINDFSEIAEEAWKLYDGVAAKAEYVFESLTPAFFRELAKFEQSRLIAARDHVTGRLIGMELLLAGDTVLQDLYTGLDYTYDPNRRLYFNLIYPVISLAAENGFKTLSMGQTAYTFKARLGTQPYPLFIFLKHKNRIVHALIKLLKGVLFSQKQAITYRVFREE